MTPGFLTPSFGTRTRGGIEVSSRLVARALAEFSGGGGFALTLHDAVPPGDIGAWRRVACCGGSKLRAGWQALVSGRGCGEVFCWHLGLLPLVRLMGGGPRRVCIALNGIECWRPVKLDSLRGYEPMFLPISQYTWDQFVVHNPGVAGAAHTVLHLGVEGEPVAAGPGEAGLVVMCGRLVGRDRQKGFDETIAAWPGVAAAVPGCRLVILGDGADRRRLEGLAAGMPGIEFRGEVSDEERDGWLRRCRVFALPSRLEGFGLVYAEAMRHGRPCLVGDGDASREVARPGCESVAVDAASPDAIAAGLIELLEDQGLWERLAGGAAARFSGYLTEEAFRGRFGRILGN